MCFQISPSLSITPPKARASLKPEHRPRLGFRPHRKEERGSKTRKPGHRKRPRRAAQPRAKHKAPALSFCV